MLGRTLWWASLGLMIGGLNHGRDAERGEFPFVMRILISEEVSAVLANETLSDAGSVATGVLVSWTKVLTTCDSVGFFTGQTVNLYSLSRVSIMGGSVLKTGKGGTQRTPYSSSVHPYCYSLMVSKIVLFNYGLYEVEPSFEGNSMSGDLVVIQPIKRMFKNNVEMEMVLRSMWRGELEVDCYSASWGNPRKQFEGSGMPDYFERFSKVLQATKMTIVEYPVCYDTTCSYFGECLISVWEYGFVCARAAQGGPCNEDNGAPLVCGGQVYAIHTNPQKCEDEGIPRHFMRLDLAYQYVFNVTSGSRPIALKSPLNVLSQILTFSFWLISSSV